LTKLLWQHFLAQKRLVAQLRRAGRKHQN